MKNAGLKYDNVTKLKCTEIYNIDDVVVVIIFI